MRNNNRLRNKRHKKQRDSQRVTFRDGSRGERRGRGSFGRSTERAEGRRLVAELEAVFEAGVFGAKDDERDKFLAILFHVSTASSSSPEASPGVQSAV